MNGFSIVLIVVLCFIVLTDLMKFCWVLCDWSFQVLGEIMMDEGIRSEKRLSLGMLQHPKILSKEKQATKLGDAPVWHPLFLLTNIGILLGAIFLFVTYHEFCLEHLALFESMLDLLFSLSQVSLLDTPSWENQNYAMIC